MFIAIIFDSIVANRNVKINFDDDNSKLSLIKPIQCFDISILLGASAVITRKISVTAKVSSSWKILLTLIT